MPEDAVVGEPVRRTEDPRLLRGRGTYVDDLQPAGLLHAHFVRSIYAHARIVDIDTGPASDMPGVETVVTGGDLVDDIRPLPTGADYVDQDPEHRVIAVDAVHYVGEPVACVVARTPALARDAAEQVQVTYEPLAAVADLEKAGDEGAPLTHSEFEDNIAFRWDRVQGDVEAAMADADHIVRGRYRNQRLAGVPLETRGVLAQRDSGSRGRLTVHASTQAPHHLKTLISSRLSVPANSLRVVAPDVGGGFGVKVPPYGEELVVTYLARELDRPVKWVADRSEDFTATVHSRSQIQEVAGAFTADGELLALRLHVTADIGAYARSPFLGRITARMAPGVYDVRAVDARVTGVYTNTTPIGAYRGAGRPEGTYLIERLMHQAARKLDIDPAALRRRNFVPKDAFPYTTATDMTYDSGDYEAPLDRVLDLIDDDAFRRRQQALREEGRYLGLGFATYVEITGGSSTHSHEYGSVEIHGDGRVTVLTGTSPHGQGHETAWAQLTAERLGVSMEEVEVRHSDTDVVPTGAGTMGSRSTAVGGSAVYRALDRLEETIKALAAERFEAAPEDLVIDDGAAQVVGAPDRQISLAALARDAEAGRDLPDGMELGPLGATHVFDPEQPVYPFGCHACVIEVDVDTGELSVERYVGVDDCGRVINPLIVDGQVHGGITQGLSQALYEAVEYDASAQPVTTGLMDYAVPSAAEVPHFETDRTETPSPVNPLGAKGVGEAGTIGATPAVVNAVLDALAPLGVTHIDMPLAPDTVWQAVQAARERA